MFVFHEVLLCLTGQRCLDALSLLRPQRVQRPKQAHPAGPHLLHAVEDCAPHSSLDLRRRPLQHPAWVAPAALQDSPEVLDSRQPLLVALARRYHVQDPPKPGPANPAVAQQSQHSSVRVLPHDLVCGPQHSKARVYERVHERVKLLSELC